MRAVNIQYEDENYSIIEKAKKLHGGNWHDYLLDLSRTFLETQKEVE